MTGFCLARLLEQRVVRQGRDERSLQDEIARLLTATGVEFFRELELSERDRIDFLTHEGVGIEVKVQGGLTPVIRQLHRYAEQDRVRSLLLVTTRLQLARVPLELLGKPVHVAKLLGGAL